MRIVADLYEMVIIGGGPAGLAAALYAARARRKTVVLERDTPGGKASSIERIEDYPGFPDGIAGQDLGTAMADQAARFGAEIRVEEVLGVDLRQRIKRVQTSRGEYDALVVILATGAVAGSDGAWEFPYPELPPNSALVNGQLPMDNRGYLACNEWMETELHGVFVAGDVRQESAHQVVTAAGDGATAAIAADRYLSEEH